MLDETQTQPEQSDSVRLGRTQILVLRLLASGGAKSVRHLAYDWPGLSESAARGAVMRLGDRSLVDVAGWDGESRTYTLTERGREVELALGGDAEDQSDA